MTRLGSASTFEDRIPRACGYLFMAAERRDGAP